MGTSEKSEASIFYIEKHVCPGEFNITYYGEEFNSRKKLKSSKHLMTDSKMSGKDEGPLRIGGRRAANFTLRHPQQKNDDLGIEFWESDACFIKIAPRTMQRKSYIAFDIDSNKTVCIPCRKEEGGKYSMRFGLTRVEIECPSGAQGIEGCRIECDSEEFIESDSEEFIESDDEDDNFSDFDFEFEFDQIADSD